MSSYHRVANRPRFLSVDTDTECVRAVDDRREKGTYFGFSHLNLPYFFLGVLSSLIDTTVSSE